MKIEMPNVQKIARDLRIERPKVIAKALISTANKLASQGKAEASRKIREDYNIKAGDLSKALVVIKANTTNPRAAIIGRGPHGIALAKFGAEWKKPKLTARGRVKGPAHKAGYYMVGASVLVKRTTGRKVLPKTFIATMSSGHVGVFKRIPGSRMTKHPDKEQIRQLFGPQPTLLLGRPTVEGAVRELVQRKAEEIFYGDLKYFGGI